MQALTKAGRYSVSPHDWLVISWAATIEVISWAATIEGSWKHQCRLHFIYISPKSFFLLFWIDTIIVNTQILIPLIYLILSTHRMLTGSYFGTGSVHLQVS